MTGKVKRIVRDRGFGFIKDDFSGAELFFHRSSCHKNTNFDALREGDPVSFEETDSPKGPRAEDVQLA